MKVFETRVDLRRRVGLKAMTHTRHSKRGKVETQIYCTDGEYNKLIAYGWKQGLFDVQGPVGKYYLLSELTYIVQQSKKGNGVLNTTVYMPVGITKDKGLRCRNITGNIPLGVLQNMAKG